LKVRIFVLESLVYTKAVWCPVFLAIESIIVDGNTELQVK
jgi:hypothetical protein